MALIPELELVLQVIVTINAVTELAVVLDVLAVVVNLVYDASR